MTNTPSAIERTFSELAVGDTASSTHTITAQMVDAFVAITGDTNPLHTDEAYARATHHGKKVVHGMLTASLLSELVGMKLPGKFSLILSQETQFKKPVFIDDTLVVTGTITQKSDATHTVTLALAITRGSDIVVRGTVVVLVEDTHL
jgi:acyl dehydratase